MYFLNLGVKGLALLRASKTAHNLLNICQHHDVHLLELLFSRQSAILISLVPHQLFPLPFELSLHHDAGFCLGIAQPVVLLLTLLLFLF